MPLVTPVDPVPVGVLGRVHFIGIGGAGMSGIARIMLARGIAVSGCDSARSAQLDELAAAGARVAVGHNPDHLRAADTVVVSSAIRPDNAEFGRARAAGMLVLHRAAALASVTLGHQVIAVAGTHGKTTTSAMITTVLREAGAGPSYVIGGLLAATGLGAEQGAGATFVVEADESDGSFLMLRPDAAVVLSIEEDHLDNYADLAEIESAFAAFTARITPGGALIACADDMGAAALARRGAGGSVRAHTYGTAPGADYRVSDLAQKGMSTRLTVTPGPGTRLAAAGGVPLEISVPGRHNAMNAAAAFAVCGELGTGPVEIAAGLAAYQGARRRMEPKGEAAGTRVLDSYAHHPTELAADLAAARVIAAGGRVIALFQPHLFSRTRLFAAEFGAALGLADEVLVLDVYAAREDPEPGVTGALVANAVPGGRARFLPALTDAPRAVAAVAAPGDLVLTMGAGNVTELGPRILAELRRARNPRGTVRPSAGDRSRRGESRRAGGAS